MASITDIAGIEVGHWTDLDAATGCTLIACRQGATGGIHIGGGAVGGRNLEPFTTHHLVERCHGVLLTGGSAFGLDAVGGAMSEMERDGYGFDVGVTRVPIIAGAVIFDLGIGRADVRPDVQAGRQCYESLSNLSPEEGCVGVGAGATVGKLNGMSGACRGGFAVVCKRLEMGVTVAVAVVVNAFGDVVDPVSGHIIAGARGRDGFIDTQRQMEMRGGPQGFARPAPNTTLAVVATDARLDKAEACRVAQMTHDGFARAIRPVHTRFDGDVAFCLATGAIEGDCNTIGAVAAELTAAAIVRAVQLARSGHGVPGAIDISDAQAE